MAICKYCGAPYDPLPGEPVLYQSEMLRGCCGREDCAAEHYEAHGIRGCGSPIVKFRNPQNSEAQQLRPGRSRSELREAADARRAEVVKLHKLGYDQHGIAKALDVSQPQVSQDLRAMGHLTAESNEQERQKLIARAIELDDGRPRIEIAKELGVSRTVIHRWLTEAGRAPPKRAKDRPQLRARARELRARGMSWKAITAMLSISSATLAKFMKED